MREDRPSGRPPRTAASQQLQHSKDTPEVEAAAQQPMSKADRDQLASVVKIRARVAKAQVAEHEALLLAKVESELAAEYKPDDDNAWKALADAAQKAVAEADSQVEERCRELGIRPEFRPGLNVGWYGRGENATVKRRVELRRVAQTRIAAVGKTAKLAIEQRCVEVLTELIAGALQSEEARSFLETIPTPEQLMPPLDVAELEAAIPHDDRHPW
jgi:Holliday junction resolvase RusA-like endonuclease